MRLRICTHFLHGKGVGEVIELPRRVAAPSTIYQGQLAPREALQTFSVCTMQRILIIQKLHFYIHYAKVLKCRGNLGEFLCGESAVSFVLFLILKGIINRSSHMFFFVMGEP